MANDGMIDLGRKPEKLGKPEVAKDPKVYYPTLHLNNIEGLDDLPEGEFTFTGKGKLVSYSENLETGTCSCELEIRSISPSSKKVKKSKDAGERLDDSFDEIAKNKADAYDEEDDSEE